MARSSCGVAGPVACLVGRLGEVPVEAISRAYTGRVLRGVRVAALSRAV